MSMTKENNRDSKILNNLPSAVAISWGLVKEPQRGPKREMSIKKIVDAAVSIADEEGLPAVSMNRVASSLGFTAMSLYRYIPSKDDLLILMQESVCDIPVPVKQLDQDWREDMRQAVKVLTSVYVDHPWFADIPIYGAPITPNNFKFVDWMLGFMQVLPLNDYEKMSIVLLLSSYARSSGILTRDMVRALKAGVSPSAFSGQDYNEALKQLVTEDRFPNLFPLIQSGSYTGSASNSECDELDDLDDLEFGLERILDGIESFLAPRLAGHHKGLAQD